MLANSAALADAAREAGATIIHIPISFKEGYNEITNHPYGILAGVVDSTAFVAGSWGAEIAEEMTPADQDIIVEGKRGLDAFASTNLDFILRSKGIDRVALGGFLTNCCVESTCEAPTSGVTTWSPSPTASAPPAPRSTPTRSSTTTRCSPGR